MVKAGMALAVDSVAMPVAVETMVAMVAVDSVAVAVDSVSMEEVETEASTSKADRRTYCTNLRKVSEI